MLTQEGEFDPTTVVFNLEALDVQTSGSSGNSHSTDTSNTSVCDEFFDNFENSNNIHSYSSENSEDFYEIDTDSDNEELPTYPIMNMKVTVFDIDLPEFLQYDQDDQLNNWEYEEIDTGPSSGPFHGKSHTYISDLDGKPEVFFNSLFDERMWTILADSTNLYARSKSSTGEGNRCLDPTHPQYKKHCRLNSWCDVSTGDIKMFIAHILIMGLVNKPDLEKYWNMRTKTKVPFFGQYMSRNRFQSILWNFHMNDDSHNPPPQYAWS